MSREQWNEILEYGRWAPSAHNTQPWLFQFNEDDTITLIYDPKRLIPGTNPNGSFMAVGFGILQETLAIAAAPLGLDIEVSNQVKQLEADKEGPQHFAILKLIPRTKEETLDRALILNRRTSRLPYNGKPITDDVMDELSKIAKTYDHLLEFSSEKSEVDWVIRLNSDTMFFDMSQTIARNEVGSWMRFSDEEAKQNADGLAAYAMQIPGFIMWLFVHANWLFRIPGVYQLVRWFYERTMSGTATVAWISGPFETPEDWNKAGRMMARLWLTMTQHKIYLHPFGSVITNNEAHQKMDEHFYNQDRENNLWMLVRLGYGNIPPQAQRLPLEKMIVPPNSTRFFKAPLETQNISLDNEYQRAG